MANAWDVISLSIYSYLSIIAEVLSYNDDKCFFGLLPWLLNMRTFAGHLSLPTLALGGVLSIPSACMLLLQEPVL